ncbi:MAG: hypothetical protein ACRDV0_08695 [Acidimicrobiales bacterium]
MWMACAECGCEVDGGVRQVVCADDDCCCQHLAACDMARLTPREG